ncbi:PA14 domain-containing protein [Caldilinea sp.]|uniref:PA14 domain-containing protein n=1 Tax=Caldilinea sp. TaxID=2293560 RepID=UPI002C48247E|nr:SH3 domain-containing protein [Anaerolineales bacterium]HQY90639.1 PA14 domain-containing protein [Caldilinea sp.]HRA68525.1 PA14 domain-containing protein [Caldilinea sp.]
MKRYKTGLYLRLLVLLAAVLLLIVSAGADVQGAPATQTGGTVGVAKFDAVNVRSGPSTAYPVVGALAYGQSCPVIGRDTFSGWWLFQCPGGVTGWVSPDLVNIVGNPNSVPLYTVSGPTPSQPTPVPPPPPANGWNASYFANRDLQGSPVQVQTVPDINFSWGFGSPGPNVPPDYFSARYQRTMNMAPGYYQFTLGMDDGARLFIDGQLVLDDWRVGAFRQVSAIRYVDGNAHTYLVEYFEDTGQAAVQLTIAASAPPQPQIPTPSPGSWTVPQNQWLAQYFNNTDLAGGPIFLQYVPRGAYPLDLDWGYGSPAPNVNVDYFSARFEGIFFFDAGDYQFFTRVDDGVRIYIDNLLVVDAWWDGLKEPSNVFRRLGGGNHTVRVEYYERAGAASVRVWWSRIN